MLAGPFRLLEFGSSSEPTLCQQSSSNHQRENPDSYSYHLVCARDYERVP